MPNLPVIGWKSIHLYNRIVDAFIQYVVLHPSPKNDATHELTILFDHWIVKFGIPDILLTDNRIEWS